MQFKLKKIRSDASFREFFRLHKGKKTSIIVTAKKERFKNLIAYSAINKFLKTKGIYTPRLISQHFKEGIIEIEDFGNQTLFKILQKKNVNKYFIFKKIIKVLNKIQIIKNMKIKNFKNQTYKIKEYKKP